MKVLKLSNLPIEWLFWTLALIAIAFINPQEHQHWSLCPLSNLGFEAWCPGCGLGRSIAYLYRGQIEESLKMHWLGIPTLLVIFYRWIQLSILETKKII